MKNQGTQMPGVRGWTMNLIRTAVCGYALWYALITRRQTMQLSS